MCRNVFVFVFMCIFGLSCQQAAVEIGDKEQPAQQLSNSIKPDTNSNTSETATVPISISIYIYIGIGVGIIILLFSIQTCCLIWYFKKAKLRRINEIARSLHRNNSNDKARYYKHPSSNVIKKAEPDINVYESLAEMQRAPTPPSLDSLPRLPRNHNKTSHTSIKNPGSPNSIRSQKSTISSSSTKNYVKDIKTPSSIRHREPMPLPHEISRPEIPLSSVSRQRPKMLLPNEPVPMVTTMPSRIHSKSKMSTSKSSTLNATQDSVMNMELLEKLKKRAEINATLDEHMHSSTLTSHSNTLSSRKPVNMKLRLAVKPQQKEPRAHLQLPTRQVQYTGGYEQERDSSDNEWTIEQLEPYNLYNI